MKCLLGKIVLKSESPKPVVKLVYSRKPRKNKNTESVSKTKVVLIILWYLDSGCSKHMNGDRSQLTNFISKFLGTVKFGNDQVAKIMGYGDYQIGMLLFQGFITHCQCYYEKVGISHETSVARSPQQNGVVERRNRTLIEAARTMLIYAKAPFFLWAEAVATAYHPSTSNSPTLQETLTPIIFMMLRREHDIELQFGFMIRTLVLHYKSYFDLIPSSSDVIHTIVPPDHQVSEHNSKWTKDHPLENIIGALDRPVSTRLQLHEQALFCYYDAFLTSVKPKNYKDALTQACWIEDMQGGTSMILNV
ncbi:retrovirus-related pol polyprotein from transposon TNT 1-94 [Tanacetum coccineum]